jgi:hypothetical protein
MHVARALWMLVYYASAAVSPAILIGCGTVIVVENQDGLVPSDAYGWLGAAAGALLGLWLARRQRGSAATHRVLQSVGALLVSLGVVGGAVMYAIELTRQYEVGSICGRAILVMVLMAAGVVGPGACLWLAGFSGRRIASTVR